ncbi:MAG: OmpA family protein [Kineosporiaceae bacterium]
MSRIADRRPRTILVVGAAALLGLVAVHALVIRPALDADDGAAATALAADAAPPREASAQETAAATPSPVAPPSVAPGSVDDLLFGLPPLTFMAGSDELTPASQGTLSILVERIAAAPPGTRFEVRTHTDTEGDADYNQRLSEQRASRVCDGLIHAGVPQDRLTIVGVGESAPLVAPETTEADRERNRRVEVIALP